MALDFDSPSTEETVYLERDRSGGKHARTIVYTFVCILCTIINIHVFNALDERKTMTFRDVARLRRPNPFIGLDVFNNSFDSAHKSLLIYPTLLSQINQAEPRRAYGDDPVKFAAWGGTDPPVERQFKVTATVSTVVEFRAIDYKMENCQLLITTPAAIALETTLHLGTGENWLNIWKLNLKYPIDMKSLSWKTRPSRARKLDTVAIVPGMNYTYHFPCPFDSLHAFEFSAADDYTDVTWYQNHSDPNPAVVMMQATSEDASIGDPLSLLMESFRTSQYDFDTSHPKLPWSIHKLEHVAMRIIPWSVHYELGSKSWQNLLPSGGHVVHLANPDGTVGTFTVAMFHQLHCLEILQQSYLDEGSHLELPLAQHCLNYLRQTILCQMDLRNEEQSSYPTNNGADAMCYDWEPIYKEATSNFMAYSQYSNT